MPTFCEFRATFSLDCSFLGERPPAQGPRRPRDARGLLPPVHPVQVRQALQEGPHPGDTAGAAGADAAQDKGPAALQGIVICKTMVECSFIFGTRHF